jgi:hypothetical protein
MYWYDWHGPGYSLMKSRISVRSSKHSHLTVQNPTLQSNKTSKVQGREHSSVHENNVQQLHWNATGHKEDGHEEIITEDDIDDFRFLFD